MSAATAPPGEIGAPELLVCGARQLLTCAGAGPARGAAQAELGLLDGAALAISGGLISEVTSEAELLARFPEVPRFDAAGAVVMPGFVDCHTHLLFGGHRASEWEQRMAGVSYLELLKAGGGILSSMRHTRAATDDELYAHARKWLRRMLELGTTTVEAKTGYCLDQAGELRLLRLHRRLNSEGPQRVISTYLGAHVVPPEFHADRAGYVDLVKETLAQAAAEGLCDFVDVFCEREAFTLEETRELLQYGLSAGVGLKLHTEQFTECGGTTLGVELGATSLDHLEVLSPAALERLGTSPNPPVCVLLPGVAFHLRLDTHAPGRALVDAGVPVALATDFNPGSSPTPSMPLMIAMASRTQGLSVAEAIVAATRNAAHAVGRGAELGSLEVGKRADLLCLDVPDYRFLGYGFGYSPVTQVLIGGVPQL